MNIELHHGDCLEIMPTLPEKSIDAILTDLPYGTTACSWDTVIPFGDMWREVKRVLKPRGVFVTTASQPFTSLLITSNLDWFKYEWIWNKKLPTDFLNAKNKPLKLHENIVVFTPCTTANGSDRKMIYNPQMWQSEPYKKSRTKDPRIGVWEKGNRKPFELYDLTSDGKRYPVSIVDFSNADRSDKNHPTQKPVALYEYLALTYTNPDNMILDFCMGSGTTGEACIKTGRNFIGIEKEERYFEIAKNRLKKAQQQILLPGI